MALLERFYDPATAVVDRGLPGLDDAASDTKTATDAQSAKVSEKRAAKELQDVVVSAKSGDGAAANKAKRIREAAEAHGSVLIDGVDVRTMDVQFLRSLIGMVGQEPVLFDASVVRPWLFTDPVCLCS